MDTPTQETILTIWWSSLALLAVVTAAGFGDELVGRLADWAQP